LQPAVATLGGLTAILGPASLPAAMEKIETTGFAALVCARASLHSRTFDPSLVRE
jgi:hypothetical protein